MMNTVSSLEDTIDRVLLGTFRGSTFRGSTLSGSNTAASPLDLMLGALQGPIPSPKKKMDAVSEDEIPLTPNVANCAAILDEVELHVSLDMDTHNCAKKARDALTTLMQEAGEEEGCVRWEGLTSSSAKEAVRACHLLAKCLISSQSTLRLVPPVLQLLWSMIDGRQTPPPPGFAKRTCLTTGVIKPMHPGPSEFPFTRPDAHGRAAAWCSPYDHQLLKARYEEAVGSYYQQAGRTSDALARFSHVYSAHCTVLGPQHPRTVDTFLTVLELTEETGSRDISDGLRYVDGSLPAPTDLVDDDHALVWARFRRMQATYAVHRGRHTEGQVCLRDVVSVLEARPKISVSVARVLALTQLQCSELETCDDGEGPAGIETGFRRFQHAKHILSRLYPSDHPLVLHATCRLAALFVRRAVLEGLSQRYHLDPTEGGLSQEECFERAVTLLSACMVEAKTDVSHIEVLTSYGDLLFEAGALSLAAGFFSAGTRLAGVVIGTRHSSYFALVYKWCSALLCEADDTHPHAAPTQWHDRAQRDLVSFSRGLPECELDSSTSMIQVLMGGFEAGLPTPPAAQLHHLKGTQLRVEGDMDGAQQELEVALHSHPTPQQRCRILDALSTVVEARGDVEEAVRLTLRALTLRRTRLGDRHVDVAATHGNLAALYNKCGKWADSISCADTCCAVMREVVATRLIRLTEEPQPHSAIARERVLAVSSDHPLYRKASAIRAASVKARKGVAVK